MTVRWGKPIPSDGILHIGTWMQHGRRHGIAGLFLTLVYGLLPCEGGGQLGAENDVALSLVLESKELSAELPAGLFQIEFRALEDGSFILRKSVDGGHLAPRLEEIAGQQTFPWREVTESWKWLVG